MVAFKYYLIDLHADSLARFTMELLVVMHAGLRQRWPDLRIRRRRVDRAAQAHATRPLHRARHTMLIDTVIAARYQAVNGRHRRRHSHLIRSTALS